MGSFSDKIRNCRATLRSILTSLILTLFTAGSALAQMIMANTVVLPPYSPDIESYSDRTRITVSGMFTDMLELECTLRLTITGDNGVSLISGDNNIFSPFMLQAGVPVVLTGPDLSQYFSSGALIVSGIDPAELFSQGLPPGNYRVCARVFHDGVPWSDEAPSGCSNYFRVNYLQPPMLITPADGSEVEGNLVQNIIFSWTPSPGAPALTSYILKIVEITDPSMGAEEAMLAATTPAFFEQRVNGTSFLYGPVQPLLDPGKRYAFQVIAAADEQGTRFENFGRSEVFSFSYGQASDNIFGFAEPATTLPAAEKRSDGVKEWAQPNTTIKGHLTYYFPQDITTTGPVTNVRLKLQTGYYILDKSNKKSYLSGSLSDYYIEMIQQVGSMGWYMTINPLLETDTLPDIGTDFSFCTTDNNGDFLFSFNNPGLGLVASGVRVSYTTVSLVYGGFKPGATQPDYKKKETIEVLTGDLYMYARIIVDNPYYTSPNLDLITPGGENAVLGTILAGVRAFDLKVQVKADKSIQNQYKHDNVESMVVYLLRLSTPAGIPAREGKGSQNVEPGEKLFNMKVIAKDVTNNAGTASIKNLVIWNSDDPNDRYFIYTEALASSDVNYAIDAPVPHRFYHSADLSIFNPDYKLPDPAPVKEVVARPLPPAIAGSVYRYDDQSQPISGAAVYVIRQRIENKIITGPNGRFRFELPDSEEGHQWGILAMCEGFKLNYLTVPYSLIPGKKFVREDILMEPESKLTGTVINEKGEGILVYMRMDDGAYKEFQPACPGNVQIVSPALASGIYSFDNTDLQTLFNVNSSGELPSSPILPATRAAQALSGRQTVTASTTGVQPVFTAGTLIATPILDACSSPTPFTLYATSGRHRLIIRPVDNNYLNDTIEIDVKRGSNTLPPITLYTKKHRVTVQVTDKKSALSMAPNTPIPNASVRFGSLGEGITDSNGEVSFEYSSAGGDSLKLYVDGPQQLDYVSVVKNVVVAVSKTPVRITIALRPGGRISGTVYAGVTDSSAVAGARVYADMPGEVRIETLSDPQGKYELRNVPLNKNITLRAVKSASNYVGDSLRVALIPGPSSTANVLENVNFHLQVFNDMDISKLLGFPVEVTRLTLGGTGEEEVFISGNFTDIPSNEYFSIPQNESEIRFNNVSIIPSQYLKNPQGVPLAQPGENKVSTDRNKLKVNLWKHYRAELVGDQLLGLEVVDVSRGTGVIAARAQFDRSSLGTMLVSFDKPVWLSPGATGTMKLSAFSTETGYVSYPSGLFISDADGGSLSFSFSDLRLEASRTASYIRGDSLILNAILHTNLKNVPVADVKLPLGRMVFVTEAPQQVSFTNIHGKDLVIPLSQGSIPWSLNVSNWTLGNTNGLQFVNGFVNTGLVTVPFENIYVEQAGEFTILKGGNYKLDQLSLANLTTLNITGQKQFGFDTGKNAWKLSVSGDPGKSCAWFGGLPGMGQQERVEIENFFLVSNSYPVFNLMLPAKPMTLYSVGKFFPGLITVINEEIAIAGMIDYGVPYLNSGEKLDYKIFYFRNPDQTIGFRNEVAGFLVTPPGPVTMEFFPVTGTQTLDEKGFFAKGKVYEKIGSEKLFEFDAWLYRTVDSTSLVVDRNSNQIFRFSGNNPSSPRMEQIRGRMFVKGGSWMPLWFGGELINANGASGSLSFTVLGDLVADEQELTVANIDGPFSNINNLTYDFVNKRFTGKIDYSKSMSGASFSASAEVLFDPGGWYFMGLGSVLLESPTMSGNASVFIGNYTVNQEIVNKFIPNSRVYQLFGVPPADFPSVGQRFKGFYIQGGVSLPVPILPQFEFDLGLISAKLTHEIGGDVRMSMDFSEVNTYHAGVSIFARITAGIGASMGLVCASSSVTGKGLISADGLLTSDGQWSAEGYAEFGISGTTELGVGACDSSCDGILGIGPCIVKSASAGKALFGNFTISNSGTNFEIGFK